MPGRKDVLLICCSDGRCRKPNHIRGDLVHQIRFPGGGLFPDFCAHSIGGSEQTFEMSALGPFESEIRRLVSQITPETGHVIGELVLLHAIRTMVELKNPREIFLAYHNHCGAAYAIGLSENEVQTRLLVWRNKLAQLCPNVTVTMLRETHSECGEEHHGHEEIRPEILVEAA